MCAGLAKDRITKKRITRFIFKHPHSFVLRKLRLINSINVRLEINISTQTAQHVQKDFCVCSRSVMFE